MMLELHNVTIEGLFTGLSATIADGQMVGLQGRGKTTLLRAIVGLIPIDRGHICIDGELLTPESAPYFRRFMAYSPFWMVMVLMRVTGAFFTEKEKTATIFPAPFSNAAGALIRM